MNTMKIKERLHQIAKRLDELYHKRLLTKQEEIERYTLEEEAINLTLYGNPDYTINTERRE